MTLGKQQELFMRLLPLLLLKAQQLGFDIRGGDLFRDPRVHGSPGEAGGYGHRNSCHKLKLAIDLNLFKNGEYLSATSDHQELGLWWEQQHPLCRWGGRFKNPDGNHYSLERQGFR